MFDAFDGRKNDAYVIIFNLLKRFRDWSDDYYTCTKKSKKARRGGPRKNYVFAKAFFSGTFPGRGTSIIQGHTKTN